MLSQSKDCARVTRFICRFHGGSQPILAEASDGLLYVVKFTNNPQGPNVSFNEAMGTELFRAFGLPVAPWRVLHVTDSFLDENPLSWMELPEGRRRPAAGYCFGSLFLAGSGLRVFEILPANWIKRVRNAADFWLAWLLDVCADHSDARQAVFFAALAGQYRPVFIDFGHMFGGATGGDPYRGFRLSRYMDERFYPQLGPKFLPKVQRIADTLNVDRLRRQLAALPEEWRVKSAVGNFARCVRRVSSPLVLADTLEAMVESHQRNKCEKLRPCWERKPERSVLSPRVQSIARSRGFVA